MNIVWKRPDGGLAITTLSPEALERMAWANANRAVLDDKITLAAEQAALELAIGFVEEDLETRRNAARLARMAVQDAFAGGRVDQGALDAIEAAEKAIVLLEARRLGYNQELAALEAKLTLIAQVEEVRDTIGFDEHGHELILQNRPGSSYSDHVCLGHGLEVPADRTFRAAWTCDGTKVAVDLAKAKDVKREQIRALRGPKFDCLDAQWMKATATGNTAAAAAAEVKRQALRDAPADPAIAAATTPEALKAVLPAALK